MSDILMQSPASYESAMLTARAQQPLMATPKDMKAAKEFESMFISEMLNHMFSGVETDPLFGGGHGEEMFRSMMVQEYGRKMSEGRGIGISNQLQQMIIQLQQGQE